MRGFYYTNFPCLLSGGALGGLEGVEHEHGDGHGSDASGDGRDGGGHFLNGVETINKPKRRIGFMPSQ